jgi:hypothetical protein
VVYDYVGTGQVGEAAALADAQRRLDRELQARALRQEQARLAAALAPLAELSAGSTLLSRATLVAAGFHQHDRGA